MNGIQLLNLNYNYHSQEIIHNISTDIEPSKITCVIGLNGSGKSTLLKLMGGLLERTAGRVLIDNKEVTSYKRKCLAKKLAYLPQQCCIPVNLTVREYIELGRYSYHTWFDNFNEKDHLAVQEALDLTNLNDLAHKNVNELSVGQQQRVRIALMLAQQAKYLLLDEPMTGLDVKQQYHVLNLLKLLKNKSGKTIVVILHDLNQVREIANQVLVLKEGELLAKGPPEEIITVSFLAEAFDYPLTLADNMNNVFAITNKVKPNHILSS